ncbi:hypothetical protein B0H14DRAFT_2857684, partial [Mycena olivaceomarginata]
MPKPSVISTWRIEIFVAASLFHPTPCCRVFSALRSRFGPRLDVVLPLLLPRCTLCPRLWICAHTSSEYEYPPCFNPLSFLTLY